MVKLERYLNAAMAPGKVKHEKLPDDGYWVTTIPQCQGVRAHAKTLEASRIELREVLRGWIKLGLRLGHELPVIDGINLNKEHDNDDTTATHS